MQENSLTNYPSHYSIALQAAISSSEVLMEFYENGFSTNYKSDESPVTEADLASSSVITSFLEKTNIPVVGEEMINRPFHERVLWEQNWCVDPLDGTKEFIKKNGEFAVNIALIRNSSPVFGIIASPVLRKVLVGDFEFGVYFFDFENLNTPNKWIKVFSSNEVNSPLTVATSRSHHDEKILDFSNQLQSTFGSIQFLKKGSSLKFFDLAAGNVDVYPRYAPTMEWDIASGQAILEALGGEVVDAETSTPLKYNKEDLQNPYFIAKTHAFITV